MSTREFPKSSQCQMNLEKNQKVLNTPSPQTAKNCNLEQEIQVRRKHQKVQEEAQPAPMVGWAHSARAWPTMGQADVAADASCS